MLLNIKHHWIFVSYFCLSPLKTLASISVLSHLIHHLILIACFVFCPIPVRESQRMPFDAILCENQWAPRICCLNLKQRSWTWLMKRWCMLLLNSWRKSIQKEKQLTKSCICLWRNLSDRLNLSWMWVCLQKNLSEYFNLFFKNMIDGLNLSWNLASLRLLEFVLEEIWVFAWICLGR